MRTETVTNTYYTFDELSDDAKERAREWYREGGLDYEWYDVVYDDAMACAAIMGIEIENIYFSGFCSQGDGAKFIGSYAYKPGTARAIRAYAPQDTTLHGIADTLQAIQRPAFYHLYAYVSDNPYARGEHSGCTSIDVRNDHADVTGDQIDTITQALREFMDWIYSRLEAEYDYLMSDEAVDDNIRANEHEFNDDGTRAWP